MSGQAHGFTRILNCDIEQDYTKRSGEINYLLHYACANSLATEGCSDMDRVGRQRQSVPAICSKACLPSID